MIKCKSWERGETSSVDAETGDKDAIMPMHSHVPGSFATCSPYPGVFVCLSVADVAHKGVRTSVAAAIGWDFVYFDHSGCPRARTSAVSFVRNHGTRRKVTSCPLFETGGRGSRDDLCSGCCRHSDRSSESWPIVWMQRITSAAAGYLASF